MYPIETAPVDAFNAWLDGVLDSETDVGDALFFLIIHAHRESWDVVERWWCINALALYGVDMRKYTYTSVEEAKKAKQVQ